MSSPSIFLIQEPLIGHDPVPGKVCDCVGGVISPLLANIYMYRYSKAFRRYGLDQKYGAQLVTYADDLVVLYRHGAHEVPEKTRAGWPASGSR